MAKISIIIPIYNEERLVKKTLEEIFALNLDKEIIVIDDASSDGTTDKLKDLQSRFPFKLIVLPKNQGKGNAIREGLKAAGGFWSVVFDADLEYQPEDILRLLEKAEKYKDKKTAVYGSRFLSEYKNKFSIHYLANLFLTLLANFLFGLNLTDMETCLKLCPTGVLKNLDLKARRFEFEPEITAKLAKQKIRIIEIPVKYHRRNYKQGKKIRFKDGLIAIKILLKERFIGEG